MESNGCPVPSFNDSTQFQTVFCNEHSHLHSLPALVVLLNHAQIPHLAFMRASYASVRIGS